MAVFVLRDWTNDLDNMRPSPQFNLGLHPVDLLAQFANPRQRLHQRPRSCLSYCKQRQNQHSSSVVKGKKDQQDQFQANLDVQQFAPEEIQVKVVDNFIVVEAKHEEKSDEHGFISRNFVRRYVVPEGHDIQQVASSLSSDGILTITAPKISTEEDKNRIIPIIQTGPHKSVKDSVEDEKKETHK